MQKSILLSFLTVILTSSAVFAYQPNGAYECKYTPDKYTTYGYVFYTDKLGNITLNFSGNSGMTVDKLINGGYCKFTPHKIYSCIYPKGTCSVTLTVGGGSEISCQGEDVDTQKALQDANAGLCKTIQ